jgi:hypothetical protein
VDLLQPDGAVLSQLKLSGSVTNHAAEDRWFAGDFNGDGEVDLARLSGEVDGTVTCEVGTRLDNGVLDLVDWASGAGDFVASQRWFVGVTVRTIFLVMSYDGFTMTLKLYRSNGAGFDRSTWWGSKAEQAPKRASA